MASYIVRAQFTQQGIRTVHDTSKRVAVATKAGVKLTDNFWILAKVS